MIRALLIPLRPGWTCSGAEGLRRGLAAGLAELPPVLTACLAGLGLKPEQLAAAAAELGPLQPGLCEVPEPLWPTYRAEYVRRVRRHE
jgi:hypothetical protein